LNHVKSRFEVEGIPEDILNEEKRERLNNIMNEEQDSLFEFSRVSAIPAPGVHPRLLCSPEDLPDLRRRIVETETGRLLIANLRQQNEATILGSHTWENQVYSALQLGELERVEQLLSNPSYSIPQGHYQPQLIYALVREALDTWIIGDAVRGQAVAAAIWCYTRGKEEIKNLQNAKNPYASRVSRV